MNVLHCVQIVLWSFFGVRKGADHAIDVQRARPLPLLLVAIGLAALFVAGLVTLAGLAVSGLS
ncbi:DUF2970 domain-containing protein [Methylibium sp.]|uniref:DUF2970 domain-containing protein n=1 Tax=Methylibium sp. TaxID=2067992 RepID=UPI003D0DBDFA